MTVGIVDYGRGNIYSLTQAISKHGFSYALTDQPDALLACDKIILPGVGAFSEAIQVLNQSGISESLQRAHESGIPILGICLGMQLLATTSEEFGVSAGLNIIPGKVKKLDCASDAVNAERVPNMGWRQITTSPDPVFNGLSTNDMYYFAHSFAYFPVNSSSVIATIGFCGKQVPVAVKLNTTIGLQFHPEKSGDAGLNVLNNFLTT